MRIRLHLDSGENIDCTCFSQATLYQFDHLTLISPMGKSLHLKVGQNPIYPDMLKMRILGYLTQHYLATKNEQYMFWYRCVALMSNPKLNVLPAPQETPLSWCR